MLIKKHVFLLLSPHHPEAQTLGSVGFCVPYRSRIPDELLPAFRTLIALMLGFLQPLGSNKQLCGSRQKK